MAAVSAPARRAPVGPGAQLAIVLALALGVGVLTSASPLIGRLMIGAIGMLVFAIVALSNRVAALCMIVTWLALLGFVRRLLIPFVGWSPIDPLLAVGPAAAIILLYVGRHAASKVPRSFLSSTCLFLTLWTIGQIANPYETDFVVAVQASIFYIPPLLWFFVGRGLDADAHEKVLRTMLWVSLPVVMLGFYHSLVGFLPFELTWVGVSGQSAAIFLPGFRVRPFSTLVSPQEYGFFLAFVICYLTARLCYDKKHRLWLLGYLVMTWVALFLQASRSIFLLTLIATAVALIVRTRSVASLIALLAIGTALVLFSRGNEAATTEERQEAGEANVGDQGNSDVLVQHQVSGLVDPSSSTFSLHMQLIEQSIIDAFEQPLGAGISRGTIAEKKADQSANESAESDLPNVMAGLGLPAGIALILIYASGFAAAFYLQMREPSSRHLAWLAMMVAATNQWLNGALYSVSTSLFLVLGGVAAEFAARKRVKRRRLADVVAADLAGDDTGMVTAGR